MLGARPLLGRTFIDSEGLPDGPKVVLLSESLWRGSFHADPAIVGQSVKIGGEFHTVVGVMPAAFHFPETMGADMRKGLWLPLQPTAEMLNSRGYDFFDMVADLRPGVTLAQAQQELNAIAAHIPKTSDGAAFQFQTGLYQEGLTGPIRPVLFALFGALALVLLIACANVSNLLMRAALAASRSSRSARPLAQPACASSARCWPRA